MDLIQETNILHKYYMHKIFREQVFVVYLGFVCLVLFKKKKKKKKNKPENQNQVVTCNDVPPGSVIFLYTAVQ